MSDAPTTQQLTLYHAVPSRSAIVRWMLEEVGAPYDVQLLKLSEGEHLEPAYREINPMAKVPALAHNGTIITEAAAICCYLADTFPEANLAPPIGDPRRGPYLFWLFFGPSCIEPAIIAKSQDWSGARRGMLGWGDLDTVLKTLRAGLASASPYLLGEQFTAADVIIGSQIRFGLQFQTLPEDKTFSDYVALMEERPALQRQISKDAELAGN